MGVSNRILIALFIVVFFRFFLQLEADFIAYPCDIEPLEADDVK
jgi:hypothetical protein